MDSNTFTATGDDVNEQAIVIAAKEVCDLDLLKNMADAALSLLAPKRSKNEEV